MVALKVANNLRFGEPQVQISARNGQNQDISTVRGFHSLEVPHEVLGIVLQNPSAITQKRP